jgi:hypothetical protein
MKKIKFRYILSLFFLIITLAVVGLFLWAIVYDNSREYGGFKSLFLSSLPYFILPLTLTILFYKFNKFWARLLLYLLLSILILFLIYTTFIRQKPSGLLTPDYGSGPFLPMSPNELLPTECSITAIVNEPKAVSDSTMCTKSEPPSCQTDTNYLIPLNIISSNDILEQKSSSSCAILINTIQNTDRVPSTVKVGQKIKAKLIYGRYTSFEGYSYFYRLQDVEIIK